MGNANCSIEKHEILLEQGFFSRIENLQFFKEDARGSEEDEGCEKLLGKSMEFLSRSSMLVVTVIQRDAKAYLNRLFFLFWPLRQYFLSTIIVTWESRGR